MPQIDPIADNINEIHDGRCPTARCFNSGTPATHCGLCAECFARLDARQRRDLIHAERAKSPPPEIVVRHETNYVPHPSLTAVFALAALGSMVGAAAVVVAALLLMRHQ